MVEGQAERADRPVVVANGVVISCVITDVIGLHHLPCMAGCHLRECRRGDVVRFLVIWQLQARGQIAGAIAGQRLAVVRIVHVIKPG